MISLNNKTKYNYYLLFLVLFLLSCGDATDSLPPKEELPSTNIQTSSKNDNNTISTVEVSDTSTDTVTDEKNLVANTSKEEEEENLISQQDPDLASSKQDSTIEDVVKSVDELCDVNKVKSYQRPFVTTPLPSEYDDKLLIHTLDERLNPFITEISFQMSLARQDLSKAKQLFEKLKICALANESDEIFSVRASCAENLRTLSKIYPNEFSDEFGIVMDKLPSDVKGTLLL